MYSEIEKAAGRLRALLHIKSSLNGEVSNIEFCELSGLNNIDIDTDLLRNLIDEQIIRYNAVLINASAKTNNFSVIKDDKI